MALNVSVFASITETTPVLKTSLSWWDLCSFLGPPKPYLAKEAARLYSPAEWLPGATRGKAQVAAVHFGVLDLDHWTSDAVGELVGALTRKELAYYLASTWSHGTKGCEDICARLLVPFSRPVLPSEWPRLWTALNESLTGGRADQKCKDISRSYFFPAYQEGGHEPFTDQSPGKPVDIDALLASSGGAAQGAVEDDIRFGDSEGGTGITRDDLKALGRRLTASSKRHKNTIGIALLRMCKGEPYAKEPDTEGDDLPEGRNDLTFKMIATICEFYPLVSPEKLVVHFAPSLALMKEPTIEQATAMVVRQQAAARQTHSTLIEAAIGRTEPYTEAELQRFADLLDVSRAKMHRMWIIQRDRTYYIFRNGTYDIFSETETSNAATIYLSPAIRANVDTQKITQQGLRQKTPAELIRDYGSIAGDVEINLTAQHAYYDVDRRVMVEAPCPIRVKAKYHEDIDKFLYIFAGPKAERLRHWLAVLPALSEPCAALYLEGIPGIGKSMLAAGSARVWSEGRPTELKEALDTFNEGLAKCPLVFGDERTPVDSRGLMKTDDLREFIQARSRPYKRKFKPNATIVGCVRVILAANSKNLIQTTEQLTEEDIQAITERIFYIRGSDETLDFLASLPVGTTQRWVLDDMIAEHVMWLAENVKVPRTSNNRFLVSGEGSDITRTLAVSSGIRGRVCEWLVGYLLKPDRLRKGPHAETLAPLVRVSKGRLIVSTRAIAEGWAEYVVEKRDPPDPMKISRALGGLSKEITLCLDKKNVSFRHVNTDLLVEWAEQTGYGSRASIEEALVNIEAVATAFENSRRN